MSLNPRKPMNTRDVLYDPRFVTEGVTPTTYGLTPSNPVFSVPGVNGTIIENITQTIADKRIPGEVDLTGRTVLTLQNLINFKMNVKEADKDFLKWLFTKPGSTVTPEESKTVYHAYYDTGGSVIVPVYRGCKPVSATLSVNRQGYVSVDAQISYKTRTIMTLTQLATMLGTATAAVDPATSVYPLSHKDGGVRPFTYAGINHLTIPDISVTVEYTHSDQDTIGSMVPLYREISQRAISGTMTIMKQDASLQNNAIAQQSASFSWKLKSTTTTIELVFTFLRFLPSGEELNGDSADATMETKSFTAQTLTIV